MLKCCRLTASRHACRDRYKPKQAFPPCKVGMHGTGLRIMHGIMDEKSARMICIVHGIRSM